MADLKQGMRMKHQDSIQAVLVETANCTKEQLDEAKRNRGEKVEDGTAYRDRPLFEILKGNKAKKDAEFNERFNHRAPKALNDEKQLQDMYLSRKSFAFDCDAPSAGMAENRKVFEMALSTADATFQNLDSSEISLTDVSHYFDSDPTNLVQNLRKDEKKPSAYIADTTTANAQVRTLSETMRLDARTKLLNPKWYEGMLSNGFEDGKNEHTSDYS